jgi:type IV pilus assembly protein PilM
MIALKLGMGPRPWAGLDIGTYSVKLVSLTPGGRGFRSAEAIVPRSHAGEEFPPPSVIAGLVSECMTRVDLAPRGLRGLSVGISGPDVVVKQVSLPLMDEAEVASALRFEARKHMPFDVASMVLDHQVLARHTPEKRLDVLLAAVTQQRLDRALAPLRELGVEADIVDATPLALANALGQVRRDDLDTSEPQLLLDLGHHGSWLTLRQATQPFFARRLEWGGAQLTRAVAGAVGGVLERAEAWKLDAAASLAQPNAEAAAARRAVDELAGEVRRSLAFYGTLAHLPERMTLRVSGGTTRLAGLAARLGETLGLPAATFSPLEGLERAKVATAGPQFAQAYGLALRAG